MILAYHITFSAYGFWLPNDPRGSWSTKVWAKHLRPFGDVNKVSTRRSIANRDHDRLKRLAAKRSLRYPPVRLNGRQARAVARGISGIAAKLNLIIYACSVMPDHAHLVIARHRMTTRVITGHLKRAATRQLNEEQMHPLAGYRARGGRVPSPWVRSGWHVYLNTPERVEQCIDYVNCNPVHAGLPEQRWTFVRPFDAPRGRGG